jgi:hypothetical protein
LSFRPPSEREGRRNLLPAAIARTCNRQPSVCDRLHQFSGRWSRQGSRGP